MEEKRNINVIFHKAGNGRGAKITLPIPWLRELNITEEERSVEIEINNNEIKIKKAEK